MILEFEDGWDGLKKHEPAWAQRPDVGGMVCLFCGKPPSDEAHWNEKFLTQIGPAAYHRWYYNTHVWTHVTFMGVYCAKNVLDLWNYQEIMWEIRPSMVVEFGTYQGGSALYFATILESLWKWQGGTLPVVLTVDSGRDGATVVRSVIEHPYVRFLRADTLEDHTRLSIKSFRYDRKEPVFFILDSDHHEAHVLAELEMLRDLTRPGDYVVVEDGNINGHPVLPDFGPGPWEALEEYEARHPEDYCHDTEREQKFGMTFAPKGYLIRK